MAKQMSLSSDQFGLPLEVKEISQITLLQFSEKMDEMSPEASTTMITTVTLQLLYQHQTQMHEFGEKISMQNLSHPFNSFTLLATLPSISVLMCPCISPYSNKKGQNTGHIYCGINITWEVPGKQGFLSQTQEVLNQNLK